MVATAMERALGYGRVSTDEQEEKGYSLPDQVAKIGDCARERGYSLIETIEDHVSGRTDDRPGLNRVRELARAGAFDVLLCLSLDRLSRTDYIGAMIEAELREYGVRVEFVDEHYDDSDEGELQKGIKRTLNHYECRRIRKRTMRGRAQKARERRVMPNGGRPYGYRVISKADANAKASPQFHGRSGELLIIPEEAEIVREAFRRYAAGETIYRVAEWLDLTGAKPVRGKTWARSTVHRMLGNAAYTGTTFFGKKECKTTGKRSESGKSMEVTRKERPRDEWIEVHCPRIVDQVTFDAVAARLKGNKALRAGRPSDRWPLVGATFCGVCTGEQNQSLSVCGSPNSQKGKTFRYYRCSSATRREVPDCRTRINADRLEEMARAAIRRALEPGVLAALAREEAERDNAEAGDPQARERGIVAQLAALADREKNLLLRSLEGGFDPAMTREVVAGIHASRADLEKQLAAVRAQAARLRDPAEAAAQADAIAAKLAVGLEEALADNARFKELARLLLRVTISPGGRAEIAVLPPVAGVSK